MNAKALFIVAILAGALMLAGCGDDEPRSYTVQERDVVKYLTRDGETGVPAAAEANVLPPYQAAVEKIYVTVGKAVQEGDVIMELAAPDSTDVYYQQARQRLQNARQQLAQARERYQSQVRAAQQRLEAAREAERQARQAAQQRETIPPDQPGAAVPIDRTNPELARAIERRRQAEQAVLDAKARMEEALVPYERQLAQAQQAFEEAQTGRKQAMIRSPITGTVLDVNAEIGEVVDPQDNEYVARIVNLNAVKVYAGLERDQLDEVEVGDPVTVTLDDVPNTEFQGRVSQIYSEKAGFLRGEDFVAVIAINNEQGKAKPGMNANVSIRVDEAQDVLAVPRDALYEVEGDYAVNVRRNGQWVEQRVVVGLMSDRYAEIRSGLEEGDVVQANP